MNRVIFRWTPKSDRFEDYIHGFRRIRFDRTDDIDDVRGDSNGKRGCTYDCKIKKKKLTTTITIVGQNIVRDVTGNYTKQIYSTLSDIDTLKHFELGILFTILTGTKEHNDLFQKALSKSYQDIKTGMVKFMKEDVPSEIDGYTENMVVLAVERLKKYVFKDVVPNNDYYVATQLLLPHEHEKLTLADIVKMLKENTLIENINRVFVEEKKRTVFPEKKAATKGSELDRFLVSGDMSQFDNLFDAMGIYSKSSSLPSSLIIYFLASSVAITLWSNN